MLSLSMKPEMVVDQKMMVHLSHEQRQTLLYYEGELEEKIHGPHLSIKEKYQPGCPKCHQSVILKPDGVRWLCLRCDYYFTQAQAIVLAEYHVRRIGEEGFTDLPKYTLPELKDKVSAISPFITPSALYSHDQSLYVNIVDQLGSLVDAFASIGIVYANPAKESWQTTIIDYAGILPDTWIAKTLGVSHTTIYYYRKQFDIPSISKNFADLPISAEKIEEIRRINNQKLCQAFKKFGNTLFRDVRKEAKEFIKIHQVKTSVEIAQLLLEQKGIKLAPRTIRHYWKKIGIQKR